MDLNEYLNIDKIVFKSYSDKDDKFPLKVSNKDKSFQHIYFIKKQKYFKEKIYQNTKINDVFKELKDNNVGSITRIVPYDNLVFIQYEVMR